MWSLKFHESTIGIGQEVHPVFCAALLQNKSGLKASV